MGKTYNMNSKSDMRKFMKDLESSVVKDIKDQMASISYDYTCPNCNHAISVRVGNNTCSYCGQEILVNLPEKILK